MFLPAVVPLAVSCFTPTIGHYFSTGDLSQIAAELPVVTGMVFHFLAGVFHVTSFPPRVEDVGGK